jgi:hypothetical protein
MTVLNWRFVMPAERVVGTARPYRGYAGVERDFGRYTVRHAGMPPIDQYAGLTRDEWTETSRRPSVEVRPAQAKAAAGSAPDVERAPMGR